MKRLNGQDLVTTRPYSENKRQTEVLLSHKGESLMQSIKEGPRSILDAVATTALIGFSDDELS